MCDSGAGEDMEHLLETCGEFDDVWVLKNEVSRIVEAGDWLEKYGNVWKQGKVALLLEKSMEGVSDIVIEEVGEYAMYWMGSRGRRKNCMGI